MNTTTTYRIRVSQITTDTNAEGDVYGDYIAHVEGELPTGAIEALFPGHQISRGHSTQAVLVGDDRLRPYLIANSADLGMEWFEVTMRSNGVATVLIEEEVHCAADAERIIATIHADATISQASPQGKAEYRVEVTA